MATKLQIRRDTAANWTSANPTLSAGEFGFETDTYKLKIGDGSTAWTSLDYYADQLVSAGGVDSAGIISLLGNGSVQHIIPAGNELYDLGDSANRFRDLYLSGSTLNLGGVTLSVDSGGTLTLPEGTRVGTIRVLDSADVATIAGGLSGLDSTGVQNVIDAAYIQANQITYNTSDFADSAFVTSQINNLIDGAPGTLDTLNEIAAALNDDAAAYDTLLSLINAKTDYDSADTLGLIDSAYIQLRRPAETIMTVTGDGANYYFTGDGFPSTSSGDPTLYLTRGKTYQFEGISGSHPFEIRQSAGGSAYSTGVTNNGGSGTVIFTVPMNAPTSLVYQCTVHSGMVGDIVILDNTTGGSGGLDSAAVTTLIDSAYVQARQTSSGSGGLDSAATISLINNNTNSGFYKYKYTATAGQTVFADSDANGNVMSFDPNSTLVFYNGVLLDETTDYTASSNTVTLTSGADAGVSITVAKYGVGYVAPSGWYGDRGFSIGGFISYPNAQNNIDYYDITTPGNATDFGDMTSQFYGSVSFSDATYAVSAGNYLWDGTGPTNVIEYFATASTGNASDFGDLSNTVENAAGACDATYGFIIGGQWGGAAANTIEYITVQTPSNSSDFGDLTEAKRLCGGCSDGTYAYHCGNQDTDWSYDIEYFVTATPGNASDFGDLVVQKRYRRALTEGTTVVVGGGEHTGYRDSIDYFTAGTPGNASDFGDLTVGRQGTAPAGNSTRACWAGGYSGSNENVIDYITYATPGNATDFGDITTAVQGPSGCSGSPA